MMNIGNANLGPSEPVMLEPEWETILPVRDQILIQPEPPKDKTKGGIILPDSIRIPTFRGRVLAVSWFVQQFYEQNKVPREHQIRPMDRVIFSFTNGLPQDLEATMPKILISFMNVVGKVQTDGRRKAKGVTDGSDREPEPECR